MPQKVRDNLDKADELSRLIDEGMEAAKAELFQEGSEVFARALALDPRSPEALYGRAFCLRRLGAYLEAQQILDTALLAHPDDARLLTEQGLLYDAQGQTEKAIEAYDKALAVEPENENRLSWKVRALRLLERYADANRAVEGALISFPESVLLWNEKGLMYYDQDRYQEAIAAFDEALKTDPANEDGLRWKIASLRQLNRYDEAGNVFDRALEQHPESVAIRNELGWWHYDQKQYQEADAAFDVTLKTDPANEDALRWKIACLRQLNRYEEARKVLDRALEQHSESVAIRNELGWWHYDQKQYREAIAAFDEALKIESSNEDALRWRIVSLRQLGQWEEAGKQIERALEQHPKNAALHNQRGWWHYDRKQYGEAVAAFDRALQLESGNEDTLLGKVYALRLSRSFAEATAELERAFKQLPQSAPLFVADGWLKMDQELFADAEKAFDQAAKLAPEWLHAKLALAEFYERSNQSQRALEILEQLRESNPNDVDVRKSLGWLYLQRNDPVRARAEFQCVLDKDSSNVDCINGLGAVYYNQNRFAEAEEYFRKVLQADPSNPAVQTNLAWALVRQEG